MSGNSINVYIVALVFTKERCLVYQLSAKHMVSVFSI